MLPEAHHPELPRGERVEVGAVAGLEEILFGPSRVADGTTNLVGALRRAMATSGYLDLKEFQRVEVVVAPYQASEARHGARRRGAGRAASACRTSRTAPLAGRGGYPSVMAEVVADPETDPIATYAVDPARVRALAARVVARRRRRRGRSPARR